jgi:hypothetical protein
LFFRRASMTIATGIAKQLVYKKEVTWNVAPSGG